MIADEEGLDVLELEDNLADAEKPPELPAGTYTAELQGVEQKTSEKGNTYYAIKFVIPQKNLPADLKEFYEDGYVLYWNRQLVPLRGDRRALFNLKQFMVSLGCDTNVTTIDPNDWMGRSARLRVVMGKYKGELRPELKSVEAAEVERTAAPAARGKRK